MAQLTQDQWKQVFGIGQAHGIDNGTIYSIIMNESGGDTTSRLVTSQEDSRGIFQINTYAHPDANTSQLYDPLYSANYWIPELATAYNKGKSQGLSGVALAQYTERYGERPQWTSQVANNIAKYFTGFTGAGGVLGDQTGSSTAPSTGGSSNPLVAVASIPQAITDGVTAVWTNTKVALAYIVIVVIIIFSIYMMYKVD